MEHPYSKHPLVLPLPTFDSAEKEQSKMWVTVISSIGRSNNTT